MRIRLTSLISCTLELKKEPDETFASPILVGFNDQEFLNEVFLQTVNIIIKLITYYKDTHINDAKIKTTYSNNLPSTRCQEKKITTREPRTKDREWSKGGAEAVVEEQRS